MQRQFKKIPDYRAETCPIIMDIPTVCSALAVMTNYILIAHIKCICYTLIYKFKMILNVAMPVFYSNRENI